MDILQAHWNIVRSYNDTFSYIPLEHLFLIQPNKREHESPRTCSIDSLNTIEGILKYCIVKRVIRYRKQY
jgi:hypothetical protein